MQRLTATLTALMLAQAGPVWGQQPPQSSGTTIYLPAQRAASAEDAQLAKILEDGANLVKAKRPFEAIPLFDRVAAAYEAKYKDKSVDYFCARSSVEELYYLAQAAASARKRNAMVVSPNWADAYYLKGYALMELNRVAEAKVQLQRATSLAPQNAQFLSEYGHVLQVQRDWAAAHASFKSAEQAAREFSPEAVRNSDLGRAWRGMAYSLIEMKRLDEAEALYRKCLELDKNDASAAHELRYIQSLRANAKRQ